MWCLLFYTLIFSGRDFSDSVEHHVHCQLTASLHAVLKTPCRTLRSTNQLLLDCPRFSTEFVKRSFSYLAPTVWNDLPLDTRLSPPLIPLSAVSRQSLRIAYQCCQPSDCLRLRFSVNADFVRLTNYYIIIIIIIIIIKVVLHLYAYVVCSMEYWAGDDIMDSETAAAFEMFMAETQKTSSSSRTVLPNCHSEVTSGHP